MNVREIVIAHLKAGGFDGLCCDGCGCGIDDLMPCAGVISGVEQCVPAKIHDCDGSCCGITDPSGGICYRPAQIQLEEEETHL